jgi:hypothetical protein
MLYHSKTLRLICSFGNMGTCGGDAGVSLFSGEMDQALACSESIPKSPLFK